MKKYLFTALALILACISVSAQGKTDDRPSGMIYGRDIAYIVSTPKGWVMDIESAKSAGIGAVFYPEGSSWAKGIAVMYTNVLGKSGPKQPLKEVIDGELADFRKHSPNFKVEDARAVSLGKDKSATVKYLTGDANGNFEAIAYINEEKAVAIVVLTSRTKKDFDSSLAAFDELVRSYRFVTDKVEIRK